MNQFITLKYGASSTILRTEVYEYEYLNINRFYITIEHDQNEEWICIEHVAHDDDFWGLSYGYIELLLNGEIKISLKSHNSREWRNVARSPYSIYEYKEICIYDLTKSQLKQIADSSNCQINIFGNKRFVNISEGSDVLHKNIPINILAQSMYNAVYDSNAYLSSLSKYIPKEYITKKVRHIESVAFLFFLIGGLVAIIGGGIWSLYQSSWGPIICCTLIDLIVIIVLLIYHSTLERKLKHK